jgi:hypothetical protein
MIKSMKFNFHKLYNDNIKLIHLILKIIIGIAVMFFINKFIPTLKIFIIPLISYTFYNCIILISGNEIEQSNKIRNKISFNLLFTGFLGFLAQSEIYEITLNTIDILYTFGIIGLIFSMITILLIKFSNLKSSIDIYSIIRILFGGFLTSIWIAIYVNYNFKEKVIINSNLKILKTETEIIDQKAEQNYIFINFKNQNQKIKISKKQFERINADSINELSFNKGYLGFYIFNDLK